jgi:IS5 family transposase
MTKAPKARDFTNQRTRRPGEADEVARAKNPNMSKIRVRVEHVFAVIKRLWGFTKVRYRVWRRTPIAPSSHWR